MLENIVAFVLEYLIPICELMGICVIAISSLGAFWHYIHSLITRTPYDVKFQLAKGLALSLEFKMAAEILKTVLVRSLEELIILAVVILLRAILSFLIHFEMKHE